MVASRWPQRRSRSADPAAPPTGPDPEGLTVTARTLLGTVVSHPEQRVVDDDAGIVFWVRPALQEHLDPVQVFVSARSADLVERVDLSLGAIVQATGQQSRGILIAGSLTSAALELPDDGSNVTVPLPVPDLARLDPGRAFRYRTFMVCWFAAFVTLGLVGMVNRIQPIRGAWVRGLLGRRRVAGGPGRDDVRSARRRHRTGRQTPGTPPAFDSLALGGWSGPTRRVASLPPSSRSRSSPRATPPSRLEG